MKHSHFTKSSGSLRYFRLLLMTLIFFLNEGSLQAQQKNPPRVLFQAFWWDYRNDLFKKPADEDPNRDDEPGRWFNYLAELAPTLRSKGINAVWIPPTIKGGSGTYSNGYDGMDHYDLGDKYQKGTTRTRLGTKDEYLRMVAVMHANGIDVIQDIVLNHMDGAGSVTGAGGIDPASAIPPGIPANQEDNYRYKNFRYVSYSSPATDESANDYLNRKGRWPVNWSNFHPNPAHNCSSGDICSQFFGPDVCYFSGAVGQSSNAIYNPVQNQNWMYDNSAAWLKWYKKQAGWDGVRLDAVKHFESGVTHGLMDELQNNAGWASGGPQMFTVGEYVGGIPEMDGWINMESDRSGTFDFSLRGAINEMATKNGLYDMRQIPGDNDPQNTVSSAQQNKRERTVPFVNNHDTFRPRRDTNGNYIGWYDGFQEPGEPDDYPNDPNKTEDKNELASHIDPRSNKHLAAAYAIICAMDGSPQIYFEDLFNIGTTGKGFTHKPTDPVELPARIQIENIIWAHQAMDWKSFAYKNRTAFSENPFFLQLGKDDVIVFEREGRALIGVNDNEAAEGELYVNSGFPAGTILKDYSGHYSDVTETTTVQQDQRVKIKVPSSDTGNGKYGYAIWAPKNPATPFVLPNPIQGQTTQEWEMDDDLGDSNPKSLKQGGAVAHYGIWVNPRTVGRIFSETGKNIHIELYPTKAGKPTALTVALYKNDGTLLKNVTGAGTLVLDHLAAQTDYYIIKVWNSKSGSTGQKVYVKATYTAPKIVNTALFNAKETADQSESLQALDTDPSDDTGLTLTVHPNPLLLNTDITVEFSLPEDMNVELSIYRHDTGEYVTTLEKGYLKSGEHRTVFSLDKGSPNEIYVLRLKTDKGTRYENVVVGER